MFLVMEDHEVCLAELFCSDVSFTFLKEKYLSWTTADIKIWF